MIGLKIPSNSFLFSSNYSAQASWLDSSHLTAASTAYVTLVLSSAVNLSLSFSSFILFLIEQVQFSKAFLASIFFLTISSSALYFSASLTKFSISSLLNLPLLLVIVILLFFQVYLSMADTFIIPFSSISNVTSIYGTPLGAGGIPSRLNYPNLWLSLVIYLSPSYTQINTPGQLSA